MKTTLLLYCLLLAVCATLFSPAKAQVNANDSLALVDFYNSTNPLTWKRHDNWLTTNPVSTWYGVTVKGTRVTELYLYGNRMGGTLPASIGNLDQLDTLNLASNRIKGSIPPEIGNLVNLASLSLYDNQLSGKLPYTIGNLAALTFLELELNQLSGAIPSSIGNLKNLVSLYLDDNQLSGPIPAAIGNLTALRYAYLNINQLSGTIPSTVGKLKNLYFLALGINQLSGHIPYEMGNLINLSYLQLSNNQLSGNIPVSFRNLTNLGFIYLSGNQLSEEHNINFPTGNNYLQGSIVSNRYTFDGMEYIAQTFHRISYNYQAPVTIHRSGNTLSVYAGGTLSNNTYRWHRKGVKDTLITGDSSFTPLESGRYSVSIRNAIARKLTLFSDTVDFTPAALQQSNGFLTAKAAQPVIIVKHMQVYPNPASNSIHVQVNGSVTITLTNSAGKTLLTKTINNTDVINVSAFANGVYYIQNKTTGETQKVVVVR